MIGVEEEATGLEALDDAEVVKATGEEDRELLSFSF
jgi:hypothetical protein